MLKDFSPIRADYAFFEKHSTEAEADLRAYQPHAQSLVASHQSIRMLDFGCGDGEFSTQFLSALRVPAERLHLSLVEPVEIYRQQVVERLRSLSNHPVQFWPALPHDLRDCFDLVLANHCLYYVPDLEGAVFTLLNSLSSTGMFLCALAGQDNLLIQFWNHCFGLIGKPVPYHTAEDFEAALLNRCVAYSRENVTYELAFPDSEENRSRIMRFLLGKHFHEVPRSAMLAAFDRHTVASSISMRISHKHFIVRNEKAVLTAVGGQNLEATAIQ